MPSPRTRGRVTLLAVAFVAVLGPAAAQARAKPDLVVSAVSASPASAVPGGELRVKDTTRNKGRRKAGRTRTGYFLSRNRKRGSDVAVGDRPVKALRKGRKSRRSGALTVPSSAVGAYFVLACADVEKL